MNLFSSDSFFDALGATYFPGQRWTPAVVDVAGQRFRLMRLSSGRLVTEWPFMDFVSPLATRAPAEPLGYLPWAAQGEISDVDWKTAPAEETLPAPFVRWERFANFESYVLWATKRAGHLGPRDSVKRKHRLEQSLGPVRFVFDDASPAAFAQCLAWKSGQYRATGLKDMFADGRNVRFFAAMRERGLVFLNALWAGERLVAAHLGARWERHCYCWIPSYDPELARFSPGRILLETLLEHSHREGDVEFDFLIGDEPYKWHYTDQARRVGPLGETPFTLRAGRAVKRGLKTTVQRWPWLWGQVQALRRARA